MCLPSVQELKLLYSCIQAVERTGAVDGEGGWFSSVTGFLGKAFYW